MEHLRDFLAELKGKERAGGAASPGGKPHPGYYVGCPVGWVHGCCTVEHLPRLYNQGGVVVLDPTAVERAVRQLDLGHASCAPEKTSAEDMRLGKCLRSLGIFPTDTLDEIGMVRFHPFAPMMIGQPLAPSWQLGQHEELKHPGQSNKTISWHKVQGKDQFLMQRLLYGCKEEPAVLPAYTAGRLERARRWGTQASWGHRHVVGRQVQVEI